MKLSITILCGSLLATSSSAFQVQSVTRSPVTSRSAGVSLAAFVDIGETAPRDVGVLDGWAASCGVQRNDGFQITTEDGIDFSAVTTQPLQTGTPILSVPGGMVLSTSRARQELGDVSEAVDQLSRLGASADIPEFYLFIKILTEYQQGDQSPYFPWMNSLPRMFYNAVSMTDHCYECLPPLVFSLARGERVKFDNFNQALQKVSTIDPYFKNNEAVVKWAFNVVTTRSFGSNGEKCIVPMADMFNHGTETEIAMNYDDQGNCNVYATRDVPAGSPLRMSYGDPTNPSHLFATYGFLDETSPATFCKIMTIQPNQELRDIGYDFSKMLFYRDTGEISQEVWDVLLYTSLASNRNAQFAFYQAHMNGDAQTKAALHEQFFPQTSMALKNHVDSFLVQLDGLSQRAAGRSVAEHPRLPLIMKHNDFVRSTFMKVKDRLDQMVPQQNAALEPVYM